LDALVVQFQPLGAVVVVVVGGTVVVVVDGAVVVVGGTVVVVVGVATVVVVVVGDATHVRLAAVLDCLDTSNDLPAHVTAAVSPPFMAITDDAPWASPTPMAASASTTAMEQAIILLVLLIKATMRRF
jgi:hypothetical protein